MKIILLEDVKKHGKKGQIIEVADGFGKNYLIKNKLGVLADNQGIKNLNREKKLKQELDEKNKTEALKIKELIEKEVFTFSVKTGKQDKVFGSISAKQIAKSLEKYDIDKKKLKIDNPIDSLGNHIVELELYKNVIANIKVNVVKEK